jgi:hypothetical protein
MIILGLSSLPWIHTLMGLEEGLVNNQRLFDGFSSNAVMSIIAVMIIGAGLLGSEVPPILRIKVATLPINPVLSKPAPIIMTAIIDMILTTNQGLEAGQQMDTWGLFSVTPIGIALVITGIVYFVIAGKFVLPETKKDQSESISAIEHFHQVYDIDYDGLNSDNSNLGSCFNIVKRHTNQVGIFRDINLK